MGKSQKAQKAENHPGVVLIGLDENGKPRAARFAGSHSAQAEKAAGLMALKVVPITTELEELAMKLPAGRIYANGKGLVPNIRRPAFERFMEAAGIPHEFEEPTLVAEEIGIISVPLDWSSIAPGHLVLADTAGESGWWEAIVQSLDGDTVTLRWQAFPNEPLIQRDRHKLALLSPQLFNITPAAD